MTTNFNRHAGHTDEDEWLIRLTRSERYLGDPRLELVWLFAIRLDDLGACTEHGLYVCRRKDGLAHREPTV